ncbi:MAG: ADP-dependent NAD(P)H-hydrate dehydratase, partial [Acidimicrobiales bacterium]
LRSSDLLQSSKKLGSAGEVLHVITPHDGEYKRLLGESPGDDRVAAARQGAAQLGAVVLLKGPTTIVAHPDCRVLLSTVADQRLATAGTGDVLAGVIAAGIAGGLDPFHAAGVGAELHGMAGSRGRRVGLTAGDLPPLIAETLSLLT